MDTFGLDRVELKIISDQSKSNSPLVVMFDPSRQANKFYILCANDLCNKKYKCLMEILHRFSSNLL